MDGGVMSNGEVPRLPEATSVVRPIRPVEPLGSPVPRLPEQGAIVPIRPPSTEWTPYQEPALVPTKVARRFVVVARSLVLTWAVAIVVAGIVVRSNADGDGRVVTTVGQIGLVAIAAVAISGWWWSDRVVRNVHRLDGRLPGRARCISAWVSPPLFAALLAVTVLQLEPGELVDIRPAVTGVVLAAAAWRPYALIRRALATLSRVRSDALLGAGFVLDLAGFGLLWWRLWTWPSSLEPNATGEIDVLIGTSAAAAIAFAGSAAVWALLTRDVRRAEDHRAVALATRHDHQQLRLRGIDPMDPDVRWALLRLRQEEDDARDGVETKTVSAPVDDDPAAEQRIREIVDYLRHHMGSTSTDRATGGPPPSHEDVAARLGAKRKSTPDEPPDPLERQPTTPRLYLLEGVRYLLLISMVGVVATSAWVVSRTVLAADQSVAGAIIDTDISDIDLARRAMVTAIGVMFALVALWCSILALHARRAGDTSVPEVRSYALLGLATAANVMALVLDGDVRGPDGFLFIVVALVSSVLAVVTVAPMIEFFVGRKVSLTVWAAGMPLLVLISWGGGLQRPLGPGDELQLLTFVAATHTIVAGLMLVVAAVGTADVEEAVRVSPGLARQRETSMSSR